MNLLYFYLTLSRRFFPFSSQFSWIFSTFMPVKRTLLLTLSIWSIVIDPYTFTFCILNIFFSSSSQYTLSSEHWLVNTQCNTFRRKHICWIYYSNLINTQNRQQIISNLIYLHFTLFGILSYRYIRYISGILSYHIMTIRCLLQKKSSLWVNSRCEIC